MPQSQPCRFLPIAPMNAPVDVSFFTRAAKPRDRAALVYSQRCREAYKEVPIILGGIEGSLRRIAHYDYWSDKVRRSVVVDAKCDLLLYGNAERAIVEIAHRLAAKEPVAS